MSVSCPSCERDLSYPGQPGHECYARKAQGANSSCRMNPPNWRYRRPLLAPCLCGCDQERTSCTD